MRQLFVVHARHDVHTTIISGSVDFKLQLAKGVIVELNEALQSTDLLQLGSQTLDLGLELQLHISSQLGNEIPKHALSDLKWGVDRFVGRQVMLGSVERHQSVLDARNQLR